MVRGVFSTHCKCGVNRGRPLAREKGRKGCGHIGKGDYNETTEDHIRTQVYPKEKCVIERTGIWPYGL